MRLLSATWYSFSERREPFNKVASARGRGNAIFGQPLRFSAKPESRPFGGGSVLFPGAGFAVETGPIRSPLRAYDLDCGRGLGGTVRAAAIPTLASTATADGVGMGGRRLCARDSERG